MLWREKGFVALLGQNLLNPFMAREFLDFLIIVVWIYDAFENNFGMMQ